MADRAGIPLEIEAYLARHRILTSDIAENLRLGTAILLDGSKDGVLTVSRDRAFYMVAAAERAYGEHLLAQIPRDVGLIQVCQEHLMLAAVRRFGFAGQQVCQRFAYLKREPIVFRQTIEIRPTVLAEADIIAAHYAVHDLPEIQAIIAQGRLWSGYRDGDMVGFIGQHPEGAMGMLHVFDAYRRRGYALELECFLTNYLLARGDLPRGDVIVGNEQSLRLQRKLGYEAADSYVYWLFHRDDDTASVSER